MSEPHWSTALTLWLVLGTLLGIVAWSPVPVVGSVVLGVAAVRYERWQNGRHKRG